MTREESISAALKQKEDLLKIKEAELRAKITALATENEEYAAACRELLKCGARLAVTAISGDAGEIEKLRERMNGLTEKKEKILKDAGIGDVVYECDKCKDTGYVSGKLCECIKRISKQLLLQDLSKKTPLDRCCFENFDLSLYDDPKAQKRMTGILKFAKEYSIDFNGETCENVLFMGNTGLGKTHISLSIVGEVVAKGYNVIYGSAYNMFSDMESEHFSQHTNKNYEAAVGCDLLVIDDLGGEFVSPYIQSLVYNIINTRLLGKKPTVINTNLSLQEIENLYTPRVASRLLGEYTVKAFLGKDIRQIKALK